MHVHKSHFYAAVSPMLKTNNKVNQTVMLFFDAVGRAFTECYDASFLKSSCCLHPTVEVGCFTRSVTIIMWQPTMFNLHSTSDSAFNDVISTRLPCKVHNIGFYGIGFYDKKKWC